MPVPDAMGIRTSGGLTCSLAPRGGEGRGEGDCGRTGPSPQPSPRKRGEGLISGNRLIPLLALVALAAAPAWAAPATPGPMSTDAEGRIRVQFTARQQTVLSAEVAARIASLPFREGDAFKAGQSLATFDCALYRAQLNKAEASAEGARQTLKVNRRLAELNSMGTLEVEQAAARQKEAEAEAAAMRVTVSKCSLPAPFAGRVARLSAEAHQFVQPGKPILEVIDNHKLEIQMIAPSKWLAWLKKGGHFSVKVDELDKNYPSHVIRLGARIDPVSQSISVVGEVDGEHAELLPGMSGWATVKPEK